ncbi:uncharacterized protein LOC125012415 [Mugil cephalus]|uniref:uncharacterized protein LOC125012415 n=1 Tax=Mugil cephalus TaxID=48193 RepID=UPI001FB5D9E3|nr:uncharacterized protein LOC125012415 [Mugil cephalus]
MDKSVEHVAQTAFQMELRPVSELLEDSGNYRRNFQQEPSFPLLSDSVFSEQQKLRLVLEWANGFLRGRSEVCHEVCGVNSLTSSDVKKGETEDRSDAYKHSPTAKYHLNVSLAAGDNEVCGGERSLENIWPPGSSSCKNNEQNNYLRGHKPPSPHDIHHPFSLSLNEDEETLPGKREDVKRVKPQHTMNKQSPPHISNQRHQPDMPDSRANQTLASDTATHLIKESTASQSSGSREESAVFAAASDSKPLLRSNDFTVTIYKTAGAQSKGPEDSKKIEAEGDQKERIEGDRAEENCGKIKKESDFVVHASDKMRNGEPEGAPEQHSSTCCLKLRSHLTVYEQYQLCVDQLHHIRLRQSQCFTATIQPLDKDQKEEETSAKAVSSALTASCLDPTSALTNPKQLTTEERHSHVINKKQDRKREAHTKETKSCQSAKQTPAACKPTDLMKKPAEALTSHEEVRTKPEAAALTAKPGLQRNKIRRHPGRTGHQSPQKRNEAPLELKKNSNTSSSRGTLPCCQDEIKSTKRHTRRPDDRLNHASPYRDTPTLVQPAEAHHRDDPGLKSPSEGTTLHISLTNSCKTSPAGIPACDSWLCLPDEVWLSILSLVPLRDLCGVVQVCRRLHALATDHSLWKNLRIENSALTDQWLLCVGRRCPRTLSLYSCSGHSVSSSGLETFFSLCRNSLQELKVTSCTGPRLHGDCVLSLVGQFCDRVVDVDLSWSGATDAGVKALSDCASRIRLKSVVLNGCHITDVSLKELTVKHKESLCRLEVFGCQFLTASCLQTVYEMCPGLQHLNVGQVPNVSVHSLMVMTSQLKRLISLNLTGLQLDDSTVDSLLHNCVELQSLTFSSCPGVTDLTLHSISKYTPGIRSLNVSGCKAVTDAGVQSIALGCRRVQQLDLSSTGTGNRGVSLLANYCSEHLHTVKLSFCHITLEKILKLCRHCKRLKVLHLYGCARLPTKRQIRQVHSSVQVYPLP